MFRALFFILVTMFLIAGCDFIKMRNKNQGEDENRQPVARVNTAFLYKDELLGIVPANALKEDSASWVEAYVDSWIRKQLLIQEASRKININEAEVERKILDYRYSIIAYEYQTHYIKQHLDTTIQDSEIEDYYKANIDNFILKQNIIRATFMKVPKNAPQVKKIKNWILSQDESDKTELKSYCLSFSAAY